ncbi:MAG: hypothetical protein IJ773_08690 [Lachnospiraceae bacterium]|nr:hypothetical protein [Lachnospiraceae bacterium]
MGKLLSRQTFIKGLAGCLTGTILTGCYAEDVREGGETKKEEGTEYKTETGHETEFYKDPNEIETIIWYYHKGIMSMEEEVEKELNRRLQEKGLPVNIEFRKYDYNGFQENRDPSAFDGADILCVPASTSRHDTYAELARSGEFACMDEFLQSQEGVKLRACFPENYWRGTEVDGKVYALLNPIFTLQFYFVINKKMAEKYRISEEELQGERIWELVSYIYQQEKEAGNEELIGLEACDWDSFESIIYPWTSSEEIGVYKENGKWKAKFLIDIPEYQEFLRKLNNLHLEGAYQAASRERQMGNFFAMFGYSYSKKGAALKSLSMIDETIWGDWSEEDFLILDANHLKDRRYRGNGRMIAVREASDHKTLAMKVLAAIYGDAELSELMNYGIMDKNCLEADDGNRIECLNGDYTLYFGNPFLMRASTKEDANRAEEVWKLMDQDVSPLCGFHLDTSGMEDLWLRIDLLQGQYLDSYYSGLSESIAEDEEKIRKGLESIGAYRVLPEIEEQLNRFDERKA